MMEKNYKENPKKSGKSLRVVRNILIAEAIILVIVLGVYVVAKGIRKPSNSNAKAEGANAEVLSESNTENGSDGKDNPSTDVADDKKEEQDQEQQEAERLQKEETERKEILQKADALATQYDYKKAIKLIKKYEGYETYPEMADKVAEYKKIQKTLVPYGAYDTQDQISHVFFHSLIVDTSKAFDGDYMSNGYNYWMTTVSEFKKILEEMYAQGYVLVSIHDISSEAKDETGKAYMKNHKLLLPPDKKPFVLSQDDTNYYDYMQTDGFAKRLLIDKDGYPACEIEKDGKSVVGRDFDVVPILEKFIEEHPDFSYKGARGIIGVTGYEGVIGYRTNNKEASNYNELVKEAKATADRLKELGWEFASHSYGHGHMGKQSFEEVKIDSDHWEKDVAPIVGKTDILLFPYGEDIENTLKKYTTEKYTYLYKLGFRYFCGVCSYPWMQTQDQYVRQTRRNLDGFTMHFYPEKLNDLFDVSKVIDPARPEFK